MIDPHRAVRGIVCVRDNPPGDDGATSTHWAFTVNLMASCAEIEKCMGGAYIAFYVCGTSWSQGDDSGRIHLRQCMRHPAVGVGQP